MAMMACHFVDDSWRMTCFRTPEHEMDKYVVLSPFWMGNFRNVTITDLPIMLMSLMNNT